MNKFITSALALSFVFLMPELLFAPPSMPDAPTGIPIDGGLGALIAGGAAFGIKKIRDRKNDDADMEG